MPHQRTPSISITSPTQTTSLRNAFQKKQKMSVAQAYFLAHTARSKLSKEAAKSDHDLRILVGHANLLDGLMVDLAEAEREQESWFNQTVKKASSEESKKVQWADSLPAVVEDDSDSSDSDSDSEDEDMLSPPAVPARSRARSPPPTVAEPLDFDMDDVESDDDEDDEDLQLVRTPSHSHSPPELVMQESDSEGEEEDDVSTPPSPKSATVSVGSLPFDILSPASAAASHKNGKQQRQEEVALSTSPEESLYQNGFFLPPRPSSIEAY